ASENHDSTADSCESFPEQAADHFSVLSTVSNTTIYVAAQDNQQQKRHIMISYNRSSRDICQKLYDRLIEKNYKVWMDLSDMGDDILASMARAVENSYIVLLCINQQYYTKLIRQITYVENRLSLQPRRTPTPSSMINSMQSVRMSTSDTIISSVTNNVYSRRFDDIICKYKKSISKEHYELNQLQQNELSSLIIKLREELFCDAPPVLSNSKKSDDVIEKHHCGNH
ncbi:unnamed protein product, partial [Rotaria sordida]